MLEEPSSPYLNLLCMGIVERVGGLAYLCGSPEKGEDFYNQFIHRTREMGIRIETGIFRAHMHVESVNDGPVTILLDSRRIFDIREENHP